MAEQATSRAKKQLAKLQEENKELRTKVKHLEVNEVLSAEARDFAMLKELTARINELEHWKSQASMPSLTAYFKLEKDGLKLHYPDYNGWLDESRIATLHKFHDILCEAEAKKKELDDLREKVKPFSDMVKAAATLLIPETPEVT